MKQLLQIHTLERFEKDNLKDVIIRNDREILQLKKQLKLREQEIQQLKNENRKMSQVISCIHSDSLQLLIPRTSTVHSNNSNNNSLQVKEFTTLKERVQSLEQNIQNVNNQIASTDSANKRSQLAETRQLAVDELLVNVEQLTERLTDSMNSLNIASNMIKQMDPISLVEQRVEQQIRATDTLIKNYSGIHSLYQQFNTNRTTVNELLVQFNSLRTSRNLLETKKSEINTQIVECTTIIENDHLDDDKREHAKQSKVDLFKQRNRYSESIVGCDKRLRALERQMIQFISFGEVKRIVKVKNDEQLSLRDYKWIKTLGGRKGSVSLYERNGEQCVLKKFFVDKDHSMLRRESNILNLPRHALIVPIHTIFIEKGVAYVETPYIEGGTLRQWMSSGKRRSAKEIQNMLRLILHAIHFLHSHDMIHCDLKPENILVKQCGDVTIPMLCDFELSRNVKSMSTNTTIGGSFNYLAPELLRGEGRLSTAVDMWSFGIITYELFTITTPQQHQQQHQQQQQQIQQQMLFISPHDQSLKIESNKLMEEIRGDADLLDLLNSMLRVNPVERITITELINHRFMIKVLDTSHVQQQINRNSIEILKQFINLKIKDTYKESIYLNIDNDLVDDVLCCFANLEPIDLMKKLDVLFLGEEGVDAGALTTAMYTRFFNACVGKLLTTVAEDGSAMLYVPLVDVTSSDESSAAEVFANQYESMGKVLAKALFDQRTIPIALAPYVWRYLLAEQVQNVKVTLRDLDMVDFEHANSLRIILSGIDVECLYLDFSEIDPGNNAPLTNKNKRSYLKKSIEHKLINSRHNNLCALRQGFRSIPELNLYLNQLTEVDIAVMINEQQFIDVETLISCFNFGGASDDTFREMFISFIRGLTQSEMSQLLHFATGQVALFSSGIKTPLMNPNQHSMYPRDKISLNVYVMDSDSDQRLPVAHVCFYAVDVPLYSSEQILREKVMKALELSTDGSFGVV